MRERYFFEIPIYSMNEKDYDKRMEDLLLREKDRYGLDESNPNYKYAYDSILKNSYRTWQYNQIIGYYRLYRFFSKIYGEFWKIDKKRIPFKLDKKVYKNQLISSEWSIDLRDIRTSHEFYLKLIEEIPNDHRELSKGYYLDLRLLKEIGPYIDWIKVLEQYK